MNEGRSLHQSVDDLIAPKVHCLKDQKIISLIQLLACFLNKRLLGSRYLYYSNLFSFLLHFFGRVDHYFH
jgi:hypothetical protein